MSTKSIGQLKPIHFSAAPRPLVTSPKGVVGTAAVALLVAGTRWASYIGKTPIYLTDILIFLALCGWGIASLKQGPRARSGWADSSRPSIVFGIFLVFVVVRAIASVPSVSLQYLIRDAAPFLYGVLAFISASSVARSTPETRARTVKIFWWALGFHLAWSVLSVATMTTGVSVPFADQPLFAIRPDIDAAILSVGAGMYLIQTFKSRRKFLSLVAFLVSVVCVLSVYARAGLISLIVCLICAFVFQYSNSPKRSARKLFSQFVLPAVIVLALLVVPETTVGQRLIATLNPGATANAAQINAEGTEHARSLVWAGVIEWTTQDWGREIVGSGFGNDFLSESGTLQYLEGTTYDNVRSPHDWFVGIFARMGLIGVCLAFAVCLQLAVLIIRNRKRIGSDPLLAISALLLAAILPVACVGVVLEAPFGAVPFWWSAGIIFTLQKSSNKGGRSTAHTAPLTKPKDY
jgi:hypothetical protein